MQLMSSIRQSHFVCKATLAAVVLVVVLAAYGVFAGVASASVERPQAVAGQVIVPQAEEGQAREPEANLPYLFAVFIITWALMFGYVFYMSRRQQSLQREIELLRAALNEKAGKQANEVGANQ
ncbi:MAG: CcmD family protein [SAR202 cluster bacterium]|nr:CcmD family protein [SAR202 cluster bacterium]